MTAYTPTTASVQAAYCAASVVPEAAYAASYLDGLEKFGPEFQRWLTQVRADARRQALEEALAVLLSKSRSESIDAIRALAEKEGTEG